ncbi:MAG: DUF349 domain-containing protein, partial [Acidobacteriota bacterium]
AGGDDADTVAQRLRDAWAGWKRIGSVPPDQTDGINERFLELCKQLIARHPAGLRGTELDPQSNRRKKERLCERLEAFVDRYSPASGEADLDRLAERLQKALAANTITGRVSSEPRTDWREASRQVKRLKANWERLGPVPGDIDESLSHRFHKAYSHFFELRSAAETEEGSSAAR